jgi:hypothetical protein
LIWKTHVARARLAQARGETEAAFHAVQRAEAIVDGLKRTVRHPELAAALYSITVPRVPD